MTWLLIFLFVLALVTHHLGLAILLLLIALFAPFLGRR